MRRILQHSRIRSYSISENNIRARFEDIRDFLEREQVAEKSNIRVVNVRISTPDPDSPPLRYPLKCYVTLQNMSNKCVDVSISSYRHRSVMLKDLPLNVLQLRFHDAWCPRQTGFSAFRCFRTSYFGLG